jgi:hypothetical protein
MAREAGFEVSGEHLTWESVICTEEVERLVALARADEREQGQKWFDAVTAQHRVMILAEREGCHAIRQKLQNPYQHCQISAHAFDMAVADYGAAIRARGETK